MVERLEPTVSTKVVAGMVIVVLDFLVWREECTPSPREMDLEVEGIGVTLAELPRLVRKIGCGFVPFAE